MSWLRKMTSAHFLITTAKSLHLPVTLNSVGGGHSHLLVTVGAITSLHGSRSETAAADEMSLPADKSARLPSGMRTHA
jgi:hypothetical protein